ATAALFAAGTGHAVGHWPPYAGSPEYPGAELGQHAARTGACVWRITDFPQESAIRHTQDRRMDIAAAQGRGYLIAGENPQRSRNRRTQRAAAGVRRDLCR